MSDLHITQNSYQKIYSPSFVRLYTPLKSLSEAEKEPALDLFRKLMQQHYSNSADASIQKLQGPSCTFDMMVKFLDDHTFPSCTNEKLSRIPTYIEMVIVRDLPKLTAKDELSAFKSLKEATQKFERFGIEERDVPRLVENFNEDPLKIQKHYPHLPGLAQAVYKYQTARITYDLAVTKAARKYLPQTANSIFKNILKHRVTLESTNWDKFCNFFGVKTEHRQMLEFSVSFKPPENRPQKNVRFPKDGTPIGRVKPIPLTKKERFNRRGIIFEWKRLRIRLKHLKSSNDPADRIWKVEIEKNLNSLPLPVATTFEFRDESGNSISDVALAEGGHLDKMVTVVDAANLTKNYSSAEFLKDQGESLGEEDERTLVEQIECANVIVLNKVDLVSQEELKAARAIIRSLNAKAKLIETTHAE